jgi:hypothetical protein
MKRFKNTTLALIVAVMMVFSGCINIIEEITFKRNGSGTYSLTFDLGDMISMLKQMDLDKMLNDGEDKEEGSDVAKEEREPMVQDSTINFGDVIASTGQEVENPEFWKKVNMRINVNEPEGIFDMKMYFDFKNAKEITYFHENLNKLGGDENVAGLEGDDASPLGGMGGIFKMLSGDQGIMKGKNKWAFKKRSFSRTVTAVDMDKVELSDEEQQQLDMMKMMFSTATWKTVYNFPRKVKSVDNDNSSIAKDGKTVTTSVGLIDLMEGKANLNEKIKLKRR